MPEPSFLAARRRAAIVCCATLTIPALIAFAYRLPASLFPFEGGPLWLDGLALLVFYLAYAAISLPFDIWTGHWLPRRHRRACPVFTVFLGRLGGAVALQAAVMTACSLAVLAAGRRWDNTGAAAAFAAMTLALILLRPQAARLLGAAASPAPRPRAWLLAAAWNLAGFALVVNLPWCGARSVYGLVETSLGFTLWSLAGCAVLPRLDGAALPAALYLSWAGFGWLSRAAGASAGVPERWAAAPPGA